MTPCLSAALAYAARGWRVLPVNGKIPLVKNWPTLATTDETIIRQWWHQYPDANVGLATGKDSDLFVLDIDPGHGGDESLRTLEAHHDVLPETVEVLTGGGGRHYYFTHPPIAIGNSASQLGLGLDIKTDGGMVVAPPSIHPNGRPYEWEAAHHPDDLPLAKVPAWLLAALKAERTKQKSTQRGGEKISKGQRDVALTREAGRLRRLGLSEAELLAAVLAINRERCDPPLPDKDVRKIAASIAQYPEGSQDDDAGLTKILADEILRHDHFCRDPGGLLYVYHQGCYRPQGEAHITRQVKRLLELNGDTKRWSTHRANEVMEYLRVDAPALWDRPPADVVNLTNGLLNLTDLSLQSHSPDHYCSVQLPITYDATATCPQWDSFVKQVLPEECAGFPFELLAASMRGVVSDQTAVLLVGQGLNGKSTLLEAVIAFLGRDNVAAVSLHRLESDKFSVVRLVGKLANIHADLPSGHLDGTSVFKAITGGDRLAAERKFQSSFEVTLYCRLIFSTNTYPQSKDNSHAFFRRWQVVPFDVVINPVDMITDLAARLTTPTELSGALNQALGCLPQMIHRNGFRQSETVRAAKMEFQEMTDPLCAWLERYTTLIPDAMVTKKDLLIAFNGMGEASGRPPMSPKAFYAGVKRLRPTVKEAQRTVREEVKDVFLGLNYTAHQTTSPPPASADSAHSADSYQISVKFEEEREERERRLNRENELNQLNELKRVTPPTAKVDPCFACGGTTFWKSICHSVICHTCHPAPSEKLVLEWIVIGE